MRKGLLVVVNFKDGHPIQTMNRELLPINAAPFRLLQYPSAQCFDFRGKRVSTSSSQLFSAPKKPPKNKKQNKTKEKLKKQTLRHLPNSKQHKTTSQRQIVNISGAFGSKIYFSLEVELK